MRIGGVTNLHTFPACTRVDELSAWLAEWNQCRLANGKGLDDLNLRTMLLQRLPDSVTAEVKRQRHLQTIDDILNFIWEDLTQINDQRLVTLHSQRLKQNCPIQRMLPHLEQQSRPSPR